MNTTKVLRFSGKAYIISDFSSKTAKEIIKALSVFKVDDLQDTPVGNKIIIDIISYAISGSGVFGFIKRYKLRRRLKKEPINSLFEAVDSIISMIPLDDYYALTTISSQLNKILAK